LPPVTGDNAYLRRGGLAAYAVAAFSILYAVVYLGLVRTDPNNATESALAWALIAAGAVSASVATSAVGAYIGGSVGTWLTAFGIAYSLLSATHGAYAAIADAQGFADLDLSPTDPRGFATFGLAGVWLIVVGRELARRTDLRPRYAQLATVAGIDLLILFVATVLDSSVAILVAGGLASVVLGPIFWAMTGRLLTAKP
jgi:vacuolar-type H+-ATPase subunit I/STV1